MVILYPSLSFDVSGYAEPMTSETAVIVVAPDSLKGSCTSAQAAQAIARGVRSVLGARAEVREVPMADGGEGTLDTLVAVWGGEVIQADTSDALGRPRAGRVGLGTRAAGAGLSAIIEAADANGLPLVADEPLRPLDADSYGVGLLIRAALDAGASELLLCIGGSATSDGGSGMLRALGARLLDKSGREVRPGARGLLELHAIDLSGFDQRAASVSWRIACDVDNPLTGPRGAAQVFGPQKGASDEEVELIDQALARLADTLVTARVSGGLVGRGTAAMTEVAVGQGAATESACAEDLSIDGVSDFSADLGVATGHTTTGRGASGRDALALQGVSSGHGSAQLQATPGIGAAGGLALGLVALFDAELVPGSQLVGDAVGLPEALLKADIVFTGEGRFDSQSLDGKVVSRVIAASPASAKVIVLAGSIGLPVEQSREAGVAAAFSIAQGPATLAEMQRDAERLLEETAKRVCGAILFDA